MDRDLSQRLHENIGFLNAMIMIAQRSNNKRIEIDSESLEILRQLLKECEKLS